MKTVTLSYTLPSYTAIVRYQATEVGQFARMTAKNVVFNGHLSVWRGDRQCTTFKSASAVFADVRAEELRLRAVERELIDRYHKFEAQARASRKIEDTLRAYAMHDTVVDVQKDLDVATAFSTVRDRVNLWNAVEPQKKKSPSRYFVDPPVEPRPGRLATLWCHIKSFCSKLFSCFRPR